ncbi:hypothetical protein [Bacillus sp. JCM 19041]|uniref:hypothetical protein n=1 Tax=Bacillus sp. JCM 19041 TaxID=1460637 RepID=UPI0006CFE340
MCDDAVLQKVDVTALHGETSYIYLPYDKAEKVLRIEDEYLKYWKGVFEKKIEFHGDWLEVQHISFGKDLRWMCFNAEMAGAYGEYIKSLDSNCLPLGYCNGMIGYVATRQQIEEGGYEALNFIVFFQKPHPFQGEIETTIKDQTAKMLKGEK